MDPSVVVVGSCMIDLISYTKALPKPGETIHGSSFTIGFGGKGANQCVAAAKLGAHTALVACVGRDTFGENYLQELERVQVNKDHVNSVEGVSTGVATIVVDAKGENAIVIVGGANEKMNEKIVENAQPLIERARVVVCQGEINETATIAALSLAKRHQVTTLMNAAPAHADMGDEIYSLSNIFCVNETEAEILTSKKISCVDEAMEACKLLKAKGCEEVILTLGSEGVVYYSDEVLKHIPAPKVANVVDTTGAGDAFIGALAYFMADSRQELSRVEMIDRSCQIASMSIQKKGTQASYPSGEDVLDILRI